MTDDMAGSTDTVKYRLGQVENAVHDLSCKVDSLASSVALAEDRRVTDRHLPERVRVLEDQQLEVRIYLRQARWIAAGVLGAFIVGAVNLILSLSALGGS